MKLIRLRGKYAVGEHTHAIVDDGRFEELNKHKWKAKPNRPNGNVYAIRTRMINGKMKDIRMHRVVIGVNYDGIHDLDHINRNSLDNRRINLRLCTRAENCANSNFNSTTNLHPQPKKYLCIPHTCGIKFGSCLECGVRFTNKSGKQKYCSDECRYKDKARKDRTSKLVENCLECGHTFTNVSGNRKYCSDECRCTNWNKKRRVV